MSISTDRSTSRLAAGLAVLMGLVGLTVVPAEAGESPPPPAEVALSELELGFAKSGEVYILVDPKAGALEIKVRGIAVESLPLSGVGFYAYRSGGTAGSRPAIALPGVWTIDEDATSPYRKVIAPTELVPYSEDYEPPPPPPPPPGAPATPDGEHATVLPDVYQVQLDRDLVLSVARNLPPTDLWSRLRQAFADGWARLRRHQLERPDLLVLALDAEAANKLHFRLRKGTPLLVAAPLCPSAHDRTRSSGSAADPRSISESGLPKPGSSWPGLP